MTSWRGANAVVIDETKSASLMLAFRPLKRICLEEKEWERTAGIHSTSSGDDTSGEKGLRLRFDGAPRG